MKLSIGAAEIGEDRAQAKKRRQKSDNQQAAENPVNKARSTATKHEGNGRRAANNAPSALLLKRFQGSDGFEMPQCD